MRRSFASEATLVERLVGTLVSGISPFGVVALTTEWNYNNGSTDVLCCAADRELIAFEAKLRDWRRALHQAYRNTTFARRAYVVMPAAVASRVQVHRADFELRRVGLIAVGHDGLTILIAAQRIEDPLLSWMSDRALAFFADQVTNELAASIGSRRTIPKAKRARRETAR